jgi:DNA-binding XRE family transcriptional regulator
MLLGCIADDFTGATDFANTLTRRGMRTILTIGVSKAVSPEAHPIVAIIVALKSRTNKRLGEFLFTGRGGTERSMTTRHYARLVSEWIGSVGLERRQSVGYASVDKRTHRRRAREILARNMRMLRAAQGLSQEALSRESGINRTCVSSVERCEQNVSIDNVEKIARG